MASINIPRRSIRCALCGKDDPVQLFKTSGRSLQGVYVNEMFHPLTEGEHIVRCKGCGLVYVNPQPILPAGVRTYLPKQEQAYFESTMKDRKVGNERLLKKIEALLGAPGRLLDVGCGDGLLLAQAQQRGWDPWGLEVSSELIAHIRTKYNLSHIFHGSLETASYPSSYFDAVLLINVIEHVSDPSEVIAIIARITRSGGVVAVHTPNVDSLAARLRRAKWHHYEPLEHLYYFNMSTLSRLLKKQGLEVIDSFALYSASRVKRWLLMALHRFGLRIDNGLGVLARKL